MTGGVKWFNDKKGFGFIQMEDRNEIFVHYSAITGAKTISKGQQVEFDITRGPKGQRAAKLKVIG